MSAYTTLRITRTRALQLWHAYRGKPSDKQLEAFLDDLLEDRLYNASIVGDHEADNDDDVI